MNQEIKYKIEFEGIDESIQKLSQMNHLLNDINRKNILPTSGRTTPTMENEVPSGKSGGGVVRSLLGGATAGVTAGAIGANSTNKIVESIEKTNISVAKAFQNFSATTNRIWPNLSEKQKQELINHHGRTVPPLLGQGQTVPPVPGQGQPVPPEPGHDLPNKIAKFVKGVGFTQIGGLIEKFGSLGAEVVILKIAFKALSETLKIVEAGIVAGSNAYRGGASAGIPLQLNQQLSSTFGMMGIGMPNMTLARMQLGSNNNNNINSMLNMAQTGILGSQGQAIVNMADQFKEAMKDSADNARQMANVSRENMQLAMKNSAIKREFNTFTAQFSGLLEPLISGLLTLVKAILEAGNTILEWANNHKKFTYKVGAGWLANMFMPGSSGVVESLIGHSNIGKKSTDTFKPVWPASGGGGSLTSPNTSLENLGFIINGPSNMIPENIDKIAKNTHVMVSLLSSKLNPPNAHIPIISNPFGLPALSGHFTQTIPNLP